METTAILYALLTAMSTYVIKTRVFVLPVRQGFMGVRVSNHVQQIVIVRDVTRQQVIVSVVTMVIMEINVRIAVQGVKMKPVKTKCAETAVLMGIAVIPAMVIALPVVNLVIKTTPRVQNVNQDCMGLHHLVT